MSKFLKIETEKYELAVKGEHFTLAAVRLITVSDKNDTLTEKRESRVYRGNANPVFGQIFTLTDRVSKAVTLFIIPAPDWFLPSAEIKDGTLSVSTGGYPLYVTECKVGEDERLCRDWYREFYKPTELHAMSNTWGDRNGRTRVCDEFIRREIESGADLGLDVMQIDDGWQRGIPEVYDEEERRIFEGDFWELKDEIFPNGMRSLAEYAREMGLEIGLWFAPHARYEFEHFERDLEVLKKAYHDWSVRYFKLDMVDLPDRAHCEKMQKLIDEIRDLGGTSVELDVTAHRRLGYLAPAPFGTIFVENRYTAWSNYYPHRTLRNEWMLSRYIPTSKMQFELINPELCTDKYSSDDPYRHELYGIDYLFVSVMLSNPLFWMETQFLSEKSRSLLKPLIALWKKYRTELTVADVSPIGEEPSGESVTGFLADADSSLHLLVFRESTDKNTLTVRLPRAAKTAEVIAANSECKVSLEGDCVTVSLAAPRSFAWVKLNK